MGTKRIDLTKCNNCRAIVRARGIRGREYEITGWIKTLEEGTMLLVEQDEATTLLWHNGEMEDHIIDLEIIPRDPETYRDWQVGDKVKRIVDELIANEEVIFRSGELVVCKTDNGTASRNYLCDELFYDGYRLVLTDIEKRIIEEKNWRPQDGDIVAWSNGESTEFAISIYKKNTYTYVTLFTNGKCNSSPNPKNMKIIRPATDEEKRMLFDTMAKNGKRWNAEKKVVEDIPKPYEFKARDIVMVRDAKERWKLMAFVAMSNGAYKYEVTNGEKFSAYKQCIPYNEKTMYLLGTGEDYKEEKK